VVEGVYVNDKDQTQEIWHDQLSINGSSCLAWISLFIFTPAIVPAKRRRLGLGKQQARALRDGIHTTYWW